MSRDTAERLDAIGAAALDEIFDEARRSIFVIFNGSASPDAEVEFIRTLPHVEDVAASFDRTAIILADSAEHVAQVTEAIRQRNVAIRITGVSP